MTLNNERKIIDDLQTTLTDAALGMNREKMENVVRKLVSGFKEYDTIPDKKFYALFDPRKVPADARVDFVYTPTYLACAVIICAVSEYEDLLEDEAIKETLYYGLNGCIGRKFLGAGYDDIDGFLDAMEIFAQCDVMSFIARFPEFNPLFNAAIKEAVTYLQDGLCSGKVKDPWSGESYEDKANPILELLTHKESDRVNLFVYGTLMKGQNANPLLGDCEYKGKYILKDHAMINLGAYPGIVARKGESVVGEVYSINPDIIPDLDRYEGAGQLFIRKDVTVSNDTENIKAIVYVYNHNVSASKMMRVMWGLRDEDEIWYACYGSNLSEERFRCYIEGGKYEQNGVTYPGCSDKTTWSDEAMSAFEGELYFGNKSGSWNGKGVAFYDPEVNGVTFMRLYKIKFSQFRDLRRMEGASPNWYGRIVCLGVKDNTPIYTLTSEARRPANTPCRAYLKLLANAMRNELELTDEAVLNLIINAVTA